MKLRSALLTCTLTGSFALVACGSDSKSSGEEATPASARTEIPQVKAGLDKAAEQVGSGHRDAAVETVSNTYVDHFEQVEGPLDKVDHELKEELEEGISTELRDEIKSGAGAAKMQHRVDELKAGLDTAAGKLR